MNTSNLLIERFERFKHFHLQDPNNVSLQADYFEIALQVGRFDEATELIHKALTLTPGSHQWRHRLASLSIAKGDWDEARRLLETIASEGNTDRAVHFNLACVNFAQSEFASAIERMKAYGIELDQNLSWDCALWLRCHHHLALLDEALAYFESRQKNCTDADAFGVASLIAVDASKLELARAWSKSALAVNPQQREALVANATILLADYDTQGASKSLQVALSDAPKDGRIWSAFGMAKLLEQDLDPATAAFESAVRYMPNHIGTWHGLGWCYVLKQDIAKAQKAFESAFALDRNFAENHGALAVVQALRGQKASAELSIARALKLDSRSLSARYAEAILSGDVSDSERFSKLVQRVAGQHKDAQGRSLSEVVLGKSRPLES